MLGIDREYYQRRIEQEMLAAAAATCEVVREIHLELVDRYSAQLALADAIQLGRPYAPLGLRAGPAAPAGPSTLQRSATPSRRTARSAG